ncbi:MAG: LamG domain-containing protein [Pirellulales bacterium]|nr:LamG domain-containing protein [Pirellulales bacterium]
MYDSFALRAWAEGYQQTTNVSASHDESRPVSTLMPRSKGIVARLFRHEFGVGIAVAATLFVAGFVVLAFTPVGQFLAGGRDEQNDEHKATESKEIATLSSWHRPEWVKEHAISPRNHRITAGQKIAFTSGIVEITYDTGARVVIEGPAEYVVGARSEGGGEREPDRQSPEIPPAFTPGELTNSGHLTLGALVARCATEASNGFTIHTPTASFEDLGTEFGVEVDARGQGSVHVFEGLVNMYREGESGERVAQRKLSAGDATRFAPDKPFASEGLVARRDGFKSSVPAAPTSEDVSEFLKANGAIAHWTFDNVQAGVVRNQISDNHHAKVAGQVELPDAGSVGFAEFDSNRLGRLEVVGGPELDNMGNQITLMVWIKASANGAIIHKWQSKKGYTLETSDDRAAFVLGAPINYHLASSAKLRFDRWIHVVGTYDGEVMRLYEDGREVAQYKVPRSGAEIDPYDGPLVLGARSDDSRRMFSGCVDEAAILGRALTAEQVAEIYQAYRER